MCDDGGEFVMGQISSVADTLVRVLLCAPQVVFNDAVHATRSIPSVKLFIRILGLTTMHAILITGPRKQSSKIHFKNVKFKF